jgi:hypothetical protein
MIYRNAKGGLVEINKKDYSNDLIYISNLKSIVLGATSASNESFLDGLVDRIIAHGAHGGAVVEKGNARNKHTGRGSIVRPIGAVKPVIVRPLGIVRPANATIQTDSYYGPSVNHP